MNKTKASNNTSTEKTNPILLNARTLMMEYSQATGAHISIQDHNFRLIPEIMGELLKDRNICLFCIKHQKNQEAKGFQNLYASPCREMHINAMNESQRFGASRIYSCPLGFIFWTSPILLNGHFAGSLLGSGFLGVSEEETRAKMRSISEGTAEESEIIRLLKDFPRGEPKKIEALAGLMFICAQSLSPGSKGFHETLKRRSLQQSVLLTKTEELKNQYTQNSLRSEYPLDKERELLGALRRGEVEEGRQILNEILAILFYVNPSELKFIQYRAIELAILLFRASTSSCFNIGTMLEKHSLMIKLIQETKSNEELTDALHQIVDDLAEQIHSLQGIQHASALKKAEDYILKNFSRKISLEETAKASGFSAPYFSTIFKEEMGENFSSYLNRLRVEKASALLANTSLSLSKIAHLCGFEDQSWFSKIFKHYTGTSPGKFLSQRGKFTRKIPKTRFSKDYLREIKLKDTAQA